LAVELLKKLRFKQVCGRLRIARVFGVNALETANGLGKSRL